MELDIVNEVAALRRFSVAQLRLRFAELFGEAINASNRTWLTKRILWQMQALAEGDLSQRARQRAAELARDADLRLNAPHNKATTTTPQSVSIPAPIDPRLPPPGTSLTRPTRASSYRCRVQELARHGWVGKRWQTRAGRLRGGRPFDKTRLHRLLTNVLYAGKVRYKDEVHEGEQPAIIDADTFQRVQVLLRCHGPEVGPPSLQRFTVLLKGLLRCQSCDCAMTPSHTRCKGALRYRYYTCFHAQKNGWQTCPSKSVPAQPIEQLVVEQIQRLGRDPLVLEQMLTQVRQQDETRVSEWENERVGLDGPQGKASITFQPVGLKTLAGELLGRNQEERRA